MVNRTIAIVQARMTSSRLPGKVLLPLAGEPVLQRLVNRLRRSTYLDDIVVATSTASADDPIANFCCQAEVGIHRGSLHDVLDRHANAAKINNAHQVVRIPCDKPLVDPETVDLVVAHHLKTKADYTANISMDHPTDRVCPLGFEVEVVHTNALAFAAKNANEPHQREHVLPFVYEHPEQFHIERVPLLGAALRGAHYRLTLDSVEDYRLLTHIFEDLPDPDEIKLSTILDYLDANPKLASINGSVPQRSFLSVSGVEPK